MSVNLTPPLSYANALTALKTLTSQTANFTFTDDELNTALTLAWQDSMVVNQVFDSSTTYSVGTWTYPVPAGMTVVKEIEVIIQADTVSNTQDYPVKISQDMYEVVNGSIHFFEDAYRVLGTTYTLYIKGAYKLTTNDSLASTNQINYVLWLAADTLMCQLLLKAAFVFLRNDTQIQAIVAAQKLTESRMLQYKQKLFREFEST